VAARVRRLFRRGQRRSRHQSGGEPGLGGCSGRPGVRAAGSPSDFDSPSDSDRRTQTAPLAAPRMSGTRRHLLLALLLGEVVHPDGSFHARTRARNDPSAAVPKLDSVLPRGPIPMVDVVIAARGGGVDKQLPRWRQTSRPAVAGWRPGTLGGVRGGAVCGGQSAIADGRKFCDPIRSRSSPRLFRLRV
jgi:hypothetical protein